MWELFLPHPVCETIPPPLQRFPVRSISAHCMLEGLYRNVGPSNDDEDDDDDDDDDALF